MRILSLGGLGWVIETSRTCIAINPNFASFFGSDPGYLFSYTPSPSRIDFDFTKLDGVLQLSDQCQNIHPYWLKKLEHLPIYTPQTTVVIDEIVPVRRVEFQQVFTIGDLSLMIIGCPLGDTFWDNNGAGCVVQSTTHKVLFQGTTILNSQVLKNIEFLDAIFISWSAYSTLNSASGYNNLYDTEEYYSLEDDTNNLLHLCDVLPPSKRVLFAGADITSPDGKLFRYSSKYYADFLAPYMMACETDALVYGQIMDIDSGNISSAPIIEIVRSYQTQHSFLPSNHPCIFKQFLENFGHIILLTDFGREMFGTSSIGSQSLGAARFVIKVKHERQSNDQVYEYDMRINAFVETENAADEQLTKHYPYGLLITYSVLIDVLQGNRQFWELAHSRHLMQWYLQSPKTAPVTSLFLYFQEPCNQSLTFTNFKKRLYFPMTLEDALEVC